MTLSLLWIVYEPCRCYLPLYNIGYIFFLRCPPEWQGDFCEINIFGVVASSGTCYSISMIHRYFVHTYFFPYHKISMSFRLPFCLYLSPFHLKSYLISLSPPLSFSPLPHANPLSFPPSLPVGIAIGVTVLIVLVLGGLVYAAQRKASVMETISHIMPSMASFR